MLCGGGGGLVDEKFTQREKQPMQASTTLVLTQTLPALEG